GAVEGWSIEWMSGRESLRYWRLTCFLQTWSHPVCCHESSLPGRALVEGPDLSPPPCELWVWVRSLRVSRPDTANWSASRLCRPFLYPSDCAKRAECVLPAKPA